MDASAVRPCGERRPHQLASRFDLPGNVAEIPEVRARARRLDALTAWIVERQVAAVAARDLVGEHLGVGAPAAKGAEPQAVGSATVAATLARDGDRGEEARDGAGGGDGFDQRARADQAMAVAGDDDADRKRPRQLVETRRQQRSQPRDQAVERNQTPPGPAMQAKEVDRLVARELGGNPRRVVASGPEGADRA